MPFLRLNSGIAQTVTKKVGHIEERANGRAQGRDLAVLSVARVVEISAAGHEE